MRVLIVGSTTKEYALAQKFSKSPSTDIIFVAPGNTHIKDIANCVDILPENIDELLDFAQANEIDLTVTFDEKAINQGISDRFQDAGFMIFAPTTDAAKIVLSKSAGKRFMFKTKIPTPKFAIVEKENIGIEYLKHSNFPILIKQESHFDLEQPVLCNSFVRAKRKLELNFIKQNKKVIIEDYIEGKEISFYIITDGYNAIPLLSATPYKNVNGIIYNKLGAYAPSTNVDKNLEQKILNTIVQPTLDELAQNNNPFIGILGFDIILDRTGKIYNIEFNIGISEPEIFCLLELIDEDLYLLMQAAVVGSLADDYNDIKTKDLNCLAVNLLSSTYNKVNSPDSVIEGLNLLDDNISVVFNNVSQNQYGEKITTGGDVLTLINSASTLAKAREQLYENVELIKFKGKKYISDVAKFFIPER